MVCVLSSDCIKYVLAPLDKVFVVAVPAHDVGVIADDAYVFDCVRAFALNAVDRRIGMHPALPGNESEFPV